MNYKYEMKKSLIDYLQAEKGGIRFTAGFRQEHKQTFYGRTAQECANIIDEQGIVENPMSSSSMDFAIESGFDTNDGAENLLVEAIKLSKRYEI